MSNNETFDMTRSSVPNTSDLQASIIAEAEDLPQYLEFQPAKSRSLRIFPIASSLMACFIVAWLVVIGLGNWTNTGAELVNESMPNEDLDWQEIMLTEDEWLLADL